MLLNRGGRRGKGGKVDSRGGVAGRELAAAWPGAFLSACHGEHGDVSADRNRANGFTGHDNCS